MDHTPFKHKRTTLERAEKFISKIYFSDVNLRSKLYKEKLGPVSIKHYAAPGRIPFEEAKKGDYTPVSVGESFGPIWSTHWFEITIHIPASWSGGEVHFLWNSGSEALVWVGGIPTLGLNHTKEKNYYVISRKLPSGNLEHTLYIEMACNGLFGVGNLALVDANESSKQYTLAQAEIALFNRDVFDLILDIECLHDMAKDLGENQRAYQALYTVNNIINNIDLNDSSTWSRCHEMAQAFFSQRNGDSQHTVYAMGHAHIDTAWLWPCAETIRKCARSWTCSLRLMEKWPDFIFACSQAQQYAWVKEHYPSMWKDICKFVDKGQFVPVGGTWVEMDGNIPSGEACVRQFLYGQKFFMEEFGLHCKEFWLPDTFGYSAQFPQIMQHVGITRFLTQKLSWSLVNKFPHHTFMWEGIDGSSVLAHFPPGDSYEMEGKADQLLRTVRNFRDKGRSNRSAFLYGHGDGGHGPSEEMLERLHRFQDCDGLPKVKFTCSDQFFSDIESENSQLLCRWRGELYLEMHNGTYTTWAQVKKGNRECEICLVELEALCTMACLKNLKFAYPYEEIEQLWKLLLLNQFHDILPGSSINLVFKDAMKNYTDIRKSSKKLTKESMAALFMENSEQRASSSRVQCVVNNQPFARTEIVELEEVSTEDSDAPSTKRVCRNGAGNDHLASVSVPPMSIIPLTECELIRDELLCCIVTEEDNFILSNGIIKAVVDPLGRLVSLFCFDSKTKSWSKEAIDPEHPANQFLLYDDIPLYWDAWDVMDYHLETRNPIVTPIRRVTKNSTDLRITLEVSLKISNNSYLKQEIILDDGSPYVRFNTEVTWGENRKFLKVEFPTTVHSMEVTYDIQSGFLRRPNHFNTSWDSARYEVCGHKWADISEYGFGVGIINDCKYGYSAVDGVIRLSLLKSSKNPDPKADMGVHTFSYAIMPHFGTFQEAGLIQQALSFNSPLRSTVQNVSTQFGKDRVSGAFSVTNCPGIVIQAIKMAEDRSKTVVVRLHEAFGGCRQAEILSVLPLSSVVACNGLEEALDNDNLPVKLSKEKSVTKLSLSLTPFQIVSLRCSLVSSLI